MKKISLEAIYEIYTETFQGDSSREVRGDILEEGIVFNIQKYAIHDGPGIRTTVFLQGCPLNCWWCHNPESQGYTQKILFRKDKCIGCGDCSAVCSSKEVSHLKQGITKYVSECRLCERCINRCPTEALELIGKRMSANDVIAEIEKDQIFYEQSGGGVTFSGGEPLMQVEFLTRLLDACKEKGFHTTLDTSGYACWETLVQVADRIDLFLYDLKLIDDSRHKKYTGVSNRVILDNLNQLVKRRSNIWVRIPIIPGVNDDEDNIQSIGEFLSSIGIKDVFLLPYHRIAIDKYERLGKKYKLPYTQPPSDSDLNDIRNKLSAFGLYVRIGG